MNILHVTFADVVKVTHLVMGRVSGSSGWAQYYHVINSRIRKKDDKRDDSIRSIQNPVACSEMWQAMCSDQREASPS